MTDAIEAAEGVNASRALSGVTELLAGTCDPLSAYPLRKSDQVKPKELLVDMHIADSKAGAASSLPNGSQPMPMWPKLIVILGALLTAMGGVLAAVHPASLVGGHAEINEGVRVYAGYLVSRNLAIAFLLIALLSLHSRRALSQLMALVAVIQLLDACMDGWEGRWMLVPGVLVLCLLFVMGATRLSGHRLWTKDAWVP